MSIRCQPNVNYEPDMLKIINIFRLETSQFYNKQKYQSFSKSAIKDRLMLPANLILSDKYLGGKILFHSREHDCV